MSPLVIARITDLVECRRHLESLVKNVIISHVRLFRIISHLKIIAF